MNYKEYFLRNKKFLSVGAGLFVILLIVALVAFRSIRHDNIISPKGNNSIGSVTSKAYTDNNDRDLSGHSDNSGTIPEYDYKDAPDHIGERAKIDGTVIKVFTAKSGVTFFDFCANFDGCQFSAIIFASDLDKFGDVQKYVRSVKITGLVKSYNGKAEIVLSDPGQIE